MRKVCTLSGAVLLLCLIMVAVCGDDDKKPTNSLTPVPTSLVATWWFNSAAKNGTPIFYDSLNYSSSVVNQSVAFKSDDFGIAFAAESDHSENEFDNDSATNWMPYVDFVWNFLAARLERAIPSILKETARTLRQVWAVWISN